MWLLTLFLMLQAATGKPTPYADFRDAGAGFYGYAREVDDPSDLRSVKIGVLGPEKSPEGLQLRTGVQIAVDEANAAGGYAPASGVPIPFEMAFHPDDGPWGIAASKFVEFAYEDKVWAIIGALSGQNTHIAELLAAKAWVPVITPWATDRSIDYANVPWVFRAAPDDRSQADLLIQFARAKGYGHLVALTETERDAYTGFRRIIESSRRRQFPLALHLEYSGMTPGEISSRLRQVQADAVLLWGKPDSALPLLQGLRHEGIGVPVLGPAQLGIPAAARMKDAGEFVVASACDLGRSDAALEGFRREFEARTGAEASPIALYSYDVARLVIAAVRRGGLNRARIRDELERTSFDGLTGNIDFATLGGNHAAPVLMSLSGGRWKRAQF